MLPAGARASVTSALVGAVLVGCTLGAERPAATEPGEGETPVVAAPERVRVKAGALRARLTWQHGEGGVPVEEYEIYRDGRFIAAVRPEATRYVDTTVGPGRAYRWEISARAGEIVSPRVRVRGRTRFPPLATARLDGSYRVRLTLEDFTGYDTYSRIWERNWKLTPKCLAGGPCRRVEWEDLNAHTMRGVLRREGARYAGTYTGYFFTKCRSDRQTSHVSIALRVRKAKVVDRIWRATRLTGSVSKSESPQFGCTASSGTRTAVARLYYPPPNR